MYYIAILRSLKGIGNYLNKQWFNWKQPKGTLTFLCQNLYLQRCPKFTIHMTAL